MSHVTYEWVMSCHIWVRKTTSCINESCHVIYEWVMSRHIWMRKTTSLINESCHVMSYMNESCHVTYERDTSHMKESCHVTYKWGNPHYVRICHVPPFVNEPCHLIYQRVMSHHISIRHAHTNASSTHHVTYEYVMRHSLFLHSPKKKQVRSGTMGRLRHTLSMMKNLFFWFAQKKSPTKMKRQESLFLKKNVCGTRSRDSPFYSSTKKNRSSRGTRGFRSTRCGGGRVSFWDSPELLYLSRAGFRWSSVGSLFFYSTTTRTLFF